MFYVLSRDFSIGKSALSIQVSGDNVPTAMDHMPENTADQRDVAWRASYLASVKSTHSSQWNSMANYNIYFVNMRGPNKKPY